MTSDRSPSLDAQTGVASARVLSLTNYLVILAILFLIGTAIAFVVFEDGLANRLATVAFYLFAGGVLLRVLEQAAGDAIRRALSRLFQQGRSVARRFGIDVRARSAADRWRGLVDRSGNARSRFGSMLENVLGRDRYVRIHQALGLAVPSTITGGAALIACWWSSPVTVVPAAFVGGWLVSLGLLLGLYAFLPPPAR